MDVATARATPSADGAARAVSRTRSLQLCVLAAVCLALFWRLGAWPLFDPDEGRNATIGREMLGGDLVVPHLDGFPYLDKPVLLFWLVAGAVRLWGANEAAARLPAALGGLATVGLTGALGTLLAGPATGIVAAIAIASMPLLLVFSRLVIFDTLLTAFVTAGLYCLVRARLRGRPGLWWPLAALALGLAVLTKGPVGVALPLVAWLAARGALPRPAAGARAGPLAAALVTGLAVVLPWVAAAEWREPGFLRYALVDETVLRFVSGARFHREAPVYFYVTVLPWALGAWAVVAGAAAPALVAARRRGTREGAVAAFALRAGIAMCVFFTLSASKRPQYLLPALVPAALLAALGTATAPARVARALARTAGWVTLAGIVGIGAAMANYRPTANDFAALTPAAFGIGGTVLVVWGVATALAARGHPAVAVASAAALAPGLLLALLGPLSAYADGRSARALAAAVPPGARVVAFETFEPSFVWYLGHPVIVVSDSARELTSNYVRARRGASGPAGRLLPVAEVAGALDGDGPVFVLVRYDRLAALRRLARRRLIPLAEGRRAVVLGVRASARPT